MPEKDILPYKKFPLIIPITAILISSLIYLLGAYILLGFGILVSIFYIIYCIGVELLVLIKSCTHCYYYGKICGLGKGKICALFFKKGNPEKFKSKEVHWYHLIPDFLTFIIPLVGGLIILYTNFSWFILVTMILILILSIGGNTVIRGFYACKFCKQRDLGCSAEQLFNKKKMLNKNTRYIKIF
jgi:hypothetical protein